MILIVFEYENYKGRMKVFKNESNMWRWYYLKGTWWDNEISSFKLEYYDPNVRDTNSEEEYIDNRKYLII